MGDFANIIFATPLDFTGNIDVWNEKTAEGMIMNYLDLVRRFGFVPNGGRVKYFIRSQPPFLI